MSSSAVRSVRYLCSFCSRSFDDASSRNSHEGSHVEPAPRQSGGGNSGLNSIHKCSFCFQVFANASSKLNHEKTHLGDGPFECSHCDELFFDLGEKKRHEMGHSADLRRRGEAGIVPTLPGANCVTRSEWINIQFQTECVTAGACQSAVREEYVCHFCNKRLPDASSLTHHEKLHSRPILFRCSYCPKTFSRLCHKNAHESGHMREQMLSCSFCPMQFSSHAEKANHETIHSNYGSHQAAPFRGFLTPKREVTEEGESWPSVGAGTSQPSHRFAEIAVKKEPGLDITDVRTCRAAESSSTAMAALAPQSEVVEEEEGPVSGVPVEGLTQDSRRKSYGKEETGRYWKNGVKVFKCALCPRVFNRPCHRANHEKWHRGDSKEQDRGKLKTEPNLDSILSSLTRQLGEADDYFSFKKNSRETFKAAMSKFRERRSFHCSYCPRTFEVESAKTRHEAVHNKGRTFRCSYCPRFFKRRGNRRNHEKAHSEADKENIVRSPTKAHGYEVLNEPARYTEEILKPPTGEKVTVEECKFEDDKPLNCNFCSRTFSKIGYLRQHVRHIHKLPLFSKTTSRDAALPRREIGKRRRSDEAGKSFSGTDKGLKCSYCPRRFAKYHPKRVHELSHTVVGTFKCHLCPRIFRRSSFLKVHMHTHNRFGVADEKTSGRMAKRRRRRTFIGFKRRRRRKVANEHVQPAAEGGEVGQSAGDQTVDPGTNVGSAEVNKDVSTSQTATDDAFTCPVCAKTFSVHSSMLKHKNFHYKRDTVSCPVCQKTFSCVKSMLKHRSCHYEKDQVSCPVCQMQFNTLASMLTHRTEHDESGKVKCAICQKGFNSVTSMLKHKSYHYKNKPGYSGAQKHRGLRRVRQGMAPPIVKTERSGEINCPVCQKKFASYSSMLKHKFYHDEQEEANCPVCGKQFSSNSAMLKHKFYHEPGASCRICRKKFDSYSAMMLHKESAHQKRNTDKIYRCTLCPRTFTKACHMTVHERLHSGAKRLKCSYCPRSFILACHKKNHERGHTNVHSIKCSHCPRLFVHRRYKLIHEKKMHGIDEDVGEVRKTVAGQGVKASKQRLKRRREQTVHGVNIGGQSRRKRKGKTARASARLEMRVTGNLKCSVCDRTFLLRCHLANHQLTHNIVHSYKCRFCPKVFSRAREHRSHEQKHKGHRQISEHDDAPEVLPERKEENETDRGQGAPQDGRLFNCTFCPEKFSSLERKYEHERVHLPEATAEKAE